MSKAQRIEHLPFFEDNSVGKILPLGRIVFTLNNGEINQLVYFYENEIFITETTSKGYAHYKTTIPFVGSIFSELHEIPIAATFYFFNIFMNIPYSVENGYNSKYLALPDFDGILLFENGNHDFISYNNTDRNYMHINDLFEYKTSFNGFLHHIKTLTK